MAVIVKDVEKGSIAESMGVLRGDVLKSINDNQIRDILDYRFYETEQEIKLLMERDEKEFDISFSKTRYSGIGLLFETYLMDNEKSCKNKCIFCFVDQLPDGMRESLYFKDDDERLSFLFGNYITLTNLTDYDVERIIKMRISPINVSVHTMNKELRTKMMKNRFAGEKLDYLKKLCDAEIDINCQLVLCPDINDAEELEYSLGELALMGESLQSVACVPVGLTRYREGLEKIEPYNQEKASKVIDIIEKFGSLSLEKYGMRKFYPSDEFYLLANRKLPEYDFYEDFPQIENGVGMFRNLEEELNYALDQSEDCVEDRKVTIITGTAIYPLIDEMLNEVRSKWHNVKIDLVPVKNKFFGGEIDVTGLLTGSDIIDALEDRELVGDLLIPDVCFKADEDIFLDDLHLNDLEKTLNVKIRKFGNSGEDLLFAILGNG